MAWGNLSVIRVERGQIMPHDGMQVRLAALRSVYGPCRDGTDR